MQTSGQISIGLRGIAHLLRDLSLEVPAFQRNYSWSKEQIDEYWFDLKAALTADQPLYFMGTVVLGRTASGSASVIDGQQRLATTSMLLAAVRDMFEQKGDSQRAATIQTQYLAAPSLTENRMKPKLHLNKVDQPYFESQILGLPTNLESVEPRLELAAAFSRLSEKLRDDVEGAGPKWDDRLLRWVQLLEERTQVIAVNVSDDSDAFIIFETLNDRGMELSVADLIKNYLLGLSRDELPRAQEYWVAATNAIEDVASSQEVTPFIRQWWSSRQGATRERDLYKSLRQRILSRDDSLSLLEEIKHSAPKYAALLDPEHELWTDFPDGARQSVSILLELGFEQYRPLALAAMVRLDAPEVGRILESVVSWSARGLISGGIGGGSAERFYAEAAVRVTNDRARTAEEVFLELDRMVASDTEFQASFSERRVLRTSYLRYLLRALAAQDPLPQSQFASATPLGLFPRSDPEGSWASLINDDVRKQVSARIGNYGLFDLREVGAAPTTPAERLAFFQENDLLLNQFGPAWVDLSIETVAERQSQMAAAAVVIWPTVRRSAE